MDELLNIPPIYLIIGVFFVGIYYYILIKYDKSLSKLKNQTIIKNINYKSDDVKNIHIFDEYFEGVPQYNEITLKPLSEEDNNDSDWKKMLLEIQDQSNELNSSNSLNQFLMDNNIDID